jgi:hypothetical protein
VEKIIVALGAWVTQVPSIAGINIYRWRTDVLTGPFEQGHLLTIPDKGTDRLNRAAAEKRRKIAISLTGH